MVFIFEERERERERERFKKYEINKRETSFVLVVVSIGGILEFRWFKMHNKKRKSKKKKKKKRHGIISHLCEP